jgi:AcrR family transcriptional regulator
MTTRRKPHIGRPKGASRQGTIARILSAARTCFSRTGYAATTNKQIAEEAGVTAASIYLYFDSKTALYIATVRAAYDELLPHYHDAVSAPSLPEAFRRVLAASAPLHQTDPSLAAFFSALPVEMRRHAELGSVIADEGRGVVSLFAGLVEAGVQRREIPPQVAPHVLSLFIACTIGLSLFVTSIDSSQFGGIVDAFSALIAGSLFKPPRRQARRRRA